MSSNEANQLGIIRLLNWLLVGTVVLFAAATYYVNSIEVERQQAHDTFSPYEVAFAVAQTVNEYLRFEQTLAIYALPGSQLSIDDVRLRLDIIIGRLQQFERSTDHVGEERLVVHFMHTDPGYGETMAEVKKALDIADIAINSGDTPNMALVHTSLRALNRLDSKMASFAAQASSHSAQLYAGDKRELQDIARFSEILKAILIGCGALLVGVLTLKLRLLDRTQVKLRDLTAELTRTMQSVTVQNERFDAALNNMSHALCMFDKHRKLAVYNSRFSALTGIDESELEGLSINALRKKGNRTFQYLYDAIAPSVIKRLPQLVITDLPNKHSYTVNQTPMANGGWLATFEDISGVREAEARITHMALHDSLTGLPNRAHFRQRLEHVLGQKDEKDSHMAFFFLDLDKFKDINDTLGHQVGDDLLRAVAARMLAALPDGYFPARFGGDEFAVMSTLGEAKDHQRFSVWLIDQLSRPYLIGTNSLRVGVSIGIATWSNRSPISSEELIRRADVALYQAKADGRGQTSFYLPQLDETRVRHARLEADLAVALERNEMSLVFQPIVCTISGRPISYETLARWAHPEFGPIPPETFIALAEANQTIFSIGDWVLNQACAQAATWEEDTCVSVNISPVQFRDPTLAYKISSTLEQTGLPPSRLILEITETAFLSASDTTLSTLKHLKDLGVKFSMDDFGTGYSSLQSLLRFEFDKVKIDQSFIRELPHSTRARAVVEMVTQITKKMNITSTAEGVETEEQLACLAELLCPEVQGFLISPPCPLNELPAELQPRIAGPTAEALLRA
ncbi:EAL domain-containing protein [Devosia sp. WQ 349]|uniref:putative bifunctional diguanylate cyclase/phosphodiesterase n=1 Tax=Devosia sp. WQ 349K1 TaxID=2800329 RepID=UPI0019033BA1|nr:EAL domain-containing protein [Devosia sp. WQ 349K1]MBK1793824.1 EAL domain-containing protein [Devosia sp. WQ 349K1]